MEINGFGAIMTREELQNQFGIAICEYCRKHVISEYNLRKGWVCEKSYPFQAKEIRRSVELLNCSLSDCVNAAKQRLKGKNK